MKKIIKIIFWFLLFILIFSTIFVLQPFLLLFSFNNFNFLTRYFEILKNNFFNISILFICFSFSFIFTFIIFFIVYFKNVKIKKLTKNNLNLNKKNLDLNENYLKLKEENPILIKNMIFEKQEFNLNKNEINNVLKEIENQLKKEKRENEIESWKKIIEEFINLFFINSKNNDNDTKINFKSLLFSFWKINELFKTASINIDIYIDDRKTYSIILVMIYYIYHKHYKNIILTVDDKLGLICFFTRSLILDIFNLNTTKRYRKNRDLNNKNLIIYLVEQIKNYIEFNDKREETFLEFINGFSFLKIYNVSLIENIINIPNNYFLFKNKNKSEEVIDSEYYYHHSTYEILYLLNRKWIPLHIKDVASEYHVDHLVAKSLFEKEKKTILNNDTNTEEVTKFWNKYWKRLSLPNLALMPKKINLKKGEKELKKFCNSQKWINENFKYHYFLNKEICENGNIKNFDDFYNLRFKKLKNQIVFLLGYIYNRKPKENAKDYEAKLEKYKNEKKNLINYWGF
ncbi:hypothetical protein [[Mycoplasma] collis]|uniref:hypothetical protein n=1 Tax=[Mycoplasma] collis TaxID=2127 RepID=UPI00051C9D43|nr:hypothetical protein [[Mycoplasma] collis]